MPDAIASAYGISLYLDSMGCETTIVYSGKKKIDTKSLLLLIKHCSIQINYVTELPEHDLLLVVDAQYGGGNVTRFDAVKVAMIDHHPQRVEDGELVFIPKGYQSCSTIVWELLQEEQYPVNGDMLLSLALLYGLCTDTSLFTTLSEEFDMMMKYVLHKNRDPYFDHLIMCNMSTAEMMIATDSMRDHYMDFETKFTVIPAYNCSQTVLGIIGDFMIQVDMIDTSFTYMQTEDRFCFSIRCCRPDLHAGKFANFVSKDIGSGGGHATKAAGVIFLKKWEETGFDDLTEYACEKYREFLALQDHA